MLQVHLILLRIPTSKGLEQFNMDKPGTYLDPRRVDTITPIESAEARAQDHLPHNVRAVIRYDDPAHGYRLMYVADAAPELARRRRREMHGEDSDTPDFGHSA